MREGERGLSANANFRYQIRESQNFVVLKDFAVVVLRFS